MTSSAREILRKAESLALQTKAKLSSTHLLIVMCESEGTIPEVVLRDLKVSQAMLRTSVEKEPRSESLESLREAIFSVAKSLNHHYPGAEHILLAVCGNRHWNGAIALEAIGVNLDSIETLVFEVLGEDLQKFRESSGRPC